MNERIKQLAIQAGLQLGTVLENYTTPVKTITVEQRKFAELIVRECANYITEYYPHSRYEAFYMKKHFGVK